MRDVSTSHEDYLEAMVMLGGSPTNAIRAVDVATKLGVSKPSVNKAMSSLREQGYAEQPYYGDITLTDKGYEYGRAVLDRHNLLFDFLHRVLGIPEDEAEEEACMMEHAISDASFKKWEAFIEGLDQMGS